MLFFGPWLRTGGVLRDLSSGCFPLGLLLPQQKRFHSLEAGSDGRRVDVPCGGWERVLAALAPACHDCGCCWKCLQLLAGLSECSALLRLVWAAGHPPDAP